MQWQITTEITRDKKLLEDFSRNNILSVILGQLKIQGTYIGSRGSGRRDGWIGQERVQPEDICQGAAVLVGTTARTICILLKNNIRSK